MELSSHRSMVFSFKRRLKPYPWRLLRQHCAMPIVVLSFKSAAMATTSTQHHATKGRVTSIHGIAL